MKQLLELLEWEYSQQGSETSKGEWVASHAACSDLEFLPYLGHQVGHSLVETGMSEWEYQRSKIWSLKKLLLLRSSRETVDTF